MSETELTLASGVRLRVRRVPAYAVAQIMGMRTPPAVPLVEVETATGRERVPAQRGTLEWQAYAEEVDRFNRETNAAVEAFVRDYGVAAWRFPDDPEGVWHTEPPSDWTVSEVLVRHGVPTSGIPRVDYINYVLLVDPRDLAAFLATVLGETSPLTAEEVESALRGFRG
jgi:hypothetical protein